MGNNVICLKCGKQFAMTLNQDSDISDAICPSCGGKNILRLAPSSFFSFGSGGG